MLARFYGILVGLAVGLISTPVIADDAIFFQPDELSDVTRLLESAGLRFESDEVTWLIAPDGTRVVFDYFEGQNGVPGGIRVTAAFFIGDSESALAAAQYYENTNPLASVAVVEINSGRAIFLQRDIAFGTGRTPENVVQNVSLLYQLIPYFQESLVSADPTLEALWSQVEE